MSAHENKENTKRSARTTRATHPVWVRMEPRSLTKKKPKRKMIGSPQNNQNLPTIYNLAHAFETVKTKRKELLLSASPRGDDRGAGALSGKRSFVAKSFDGVERGRFSGGIVAEADPRGGGKGHGNQNGLDPNRHWPSEKAREGLRGKDAAEDSKDAAEEAQDNGFGQELKLYVGLRGAHGEPDADLVRSVTLTSMMFITPMPPTKSDTEATQASIKVSVLLASSCVLRASSGLRMLKSSISPGRMWWRSRKSSVMLSLAGRIASGEMAAHMMSSSQSTPFTFFCAVL